jgi:hypothetical protein
MTADAAKKVQSMYRYHDMMFKETGDEMVLILWEGNDKEIDDAKLVDINMQTTDIPYIKITLLEMLADGEVIERVEHKERNGV